MKFSKLFTILLISLMFTSSAVAQTTTEGAQDLRDSVKQKVEEELSQIKQAVSKKGFVGSITSINEAAININNLQNQARQALVTTDTIIKLKNGRDGTPKDLTVGDFVLAMGEVDSQNVMTAKRLLVIATPPEETREVNFGQISSISLSSVSVVVNDQKTVTAKLLSATATNKTDAGASVKIKTSDLEAGDSVVIITKGGTSITATDIQVMAKAPAVTVTPTPEPTSTP